MALIRANQPELGLPTLSNSFSTMLDRFFDEAVRSNQNFIPSVDLKETDNAYEIDVSVPGMKKDDIKVELDGNTLQISGEKQQKDEDKDKTYHRVETEYGYFHRSFNLPESAKTEDINAEYEDGVLKIHVPKDKEKTETKKIDIK
jgi:HSP20 family protein